MPSVAAVEAGATKIKRQRQSVVLLRRLAKDPTALAGGILLGVLALVAVFAPLLLRYPIDLVDVSVRTQGPSSAYWFGTDELGRDIFSRIIYGSRYSLSIGVLGVAVGAAIGLVFGAIAGYFGKWADSIVMRLTDVLQSLPGILLAMVVSAVLGPGYVNTMLALAVGNIPMSIRLTRAGILGMRHQEYLEAAVSINARTPRIIFRHVLPNSFSPLLVSATMSIGNTIMMCAMLSFIGLGLQPPLPEWGSMIAGGLPLFRAKPWLVIFPGAFIMLSVLSLNMLGDGLRDVLDPKLKK
jgi:peptide/nickel transport system permease protein